MPPTDRATSTTWCIANGTKQTTKLVSEGCNLYEQSGELAEYKDGYIIEEIIACARKHFQAISHGDVVYDVVKTYDSLYNKVMK